MQGTVATETPWVDGTTSLMLSPTELIEKLAALAPPPRLSLIRYHGVLARVFQVDGVCQRQTQRDRMAGSRHQM